MTDNWSLKHPGAAALGLDRERAQSMSGTVRWI
jgi:hypothetical protein